MGRNDLQEKKQKTTTITTKISRLSFVLVTSSLLVLSSIAAVQLRTNNAYAQDSGGYSITSLVCELDETRGEFGTYVVTATFDAAGPSTIEFSSGVFGYFEQGGQGLISGDPDAYTLGSSEDTVVVTVNLYVGIFIYPDRPPEDALRDTATVTCEPTDPIPPLTEQFPNQGQCIKFARDNPDSGITRQDCQEAFVDEEEEEEEELEEGIEEEEEP